MLTQVMNSYLIHFILQNFYSLTHSLAFSFCFAFLVPVTHDLRDLQSSGKLKDAQKTADMAVKLLQDANGVLESSGRKDEPLERISGMIRILACC